MEAYKWFNLAGAQGHDKAPENLRRLEDAMTKEQVAEAQWASKEEQRRIEKNLEEALKRKSRRDDTVR